MGLEGKGFRREKKKGTKRGCEREGGRRQKRLKGREEREEEESQEGCNKKNEKEEREVSRRTRRKKLLSTKVILRHLLIRLPGHSPRQ